MNNPKTINVSFENLSETTSTNDYLAKLCKEGIATEFYTVTTEYQTKGKGQRGNFWESERGKNLLFSTVLYPTAFKAKNQFLLSMLVAVAITETLNGYTEGFQIKWPNDIYWKDRKIGGVLIENELEGEYINQCIVGIGLNVNQDVFVSDVPNPVSLKQILSLEVDGYILFKNIMHGIIALYQEIENDSCNTSTIIHTLYLKNLYRRKGFYPYRDGNGIFLAEFHEIEPSGHLFLKDKAGNLRRYAFKELEYILHET